MAVSTASRLATTSMCASGNGDEHTVPLDGLLPPLQVPCVGIDEDDVGAIEAGQLGPVVRVPRGNRGMGGELESGPLGELEPFRLPSPKR